MISFKDFVNGNPPTSVKISIIILCLFVYVGILALLFKSPIILISLIGVLSLIRIGYYIFRGK